MRGFAMPIEVRCKCGKRLRARDEIAGRRVKCPACGAAVRVPAAEAESAPAAPARRGCPTRNDADVEVWTGPAVVIPSLVAVSTEALCLATTLTSGKAVEIRKRLELGQAPKSVLGIGSKIIPLGDVLGASLESQRGNIVLRHTEYSGEFRAEVDPENIQFSDKKAALEFIEALRRNLGPGWVTRREQQGRFGAALKPAVGGCFSLLLTLVMLFSGPFPNWQVGCFFVFVVLVFLACMAVLGVYLVDPPLMVHLEPRGGEG
jgi:hypothetical protein